MKFGKKDPDSSEKSEREMAPMTAALPPSPAPTPAPQRTLEAGTIVGYRLHDGPNQGNIRPAIVVRAFPVEGTANLVVFVDGTNDGTHNLPVWRTGVTQGTADGQWSYLA